MNDNLKILIGAAIGAGIGYFVSGVIIEIIHLREDTDTPEEMDRMDDGYGGTTEDEFADKETFQRPTKMSKKKNYTRHFKPGDRPELQALVAKYNGDILPEEPTTVQEEIGGIATPLFIEGQSMDDFEMIEDEPEEDPSVITQEEFTNNNEGFAVVKLSYYDDDVVTNEREHPIDRPDRFLGDEALISFGESSDNEDVVYVRNRAKKCLYEIMRTNKEYGNMLVRRRSLTKRVGEEEDNASEDLTT